MDPGPTDLPRLSQILLLSIAFGMTSEAKAGEPSDEVASVDPRQGYYVAETLPVLIEQSEHDEIGAFAPLGGLGLSLRAGQMVSPWLGFGLQLEGGYAQNKRWQHLYGLLLLESQFAVWRHLAVHAGLGAGFLKATDKKERIDETVGTGGPCYAAGLSYSFFPFDEGQGGHFAIAPTARVRFLPGKDFHTLIAWVGIELAWWSGTASSDLTEETPAISTGQLEDSLSEITVPESTDGQIHEGDEHEDR